MNEQQKAMLEQQQRLKRGAAIIEGTQEQFRADGYSNMLNKYGTPQDNSTAYSFTGEPVTSDMQLIRLYESNGLFSKIIDRPSEEAVKHGLDIDYGDDDIAEYVADRLDDLQYEEKFATAEKWARLYGGSIIVMLVDDGRGLEEPLDWNNARSIEELLVFERAVVQPDYTAMYRFYTNNSLGANKKLGEPERYMITSIYGCFVVHRSRCLVFRNGKLPEQTTDANYRYWGIPEYVKIKRALRECITSHEDGVKLLERSVQAIYKMKNLANLLSTSDGEDKVIQRLQVIDMARGILNSIAIDVDGEDYDYKNFSLSGIKEVIDSTCNMLSAVTDIPQTILFGRSPAGMNSTGESDFENYYNMVENIQKMNMKANTRTVIDLILKQGVIEGYIPEKPKYKVKFAALWSMSEAEQANVEQTKAATELTKAQTAQVYMELSVVDASEVRNKLAEEGTYDIDEIESGGDELELPDDVLDVGPPITISGIDDGMDKADNEGQSIITIQMLEDIAKKNSEVIHIQTDNLDGGPGSGNWGHAGVPGKLGGSAGGGGVANRKGSKESGFTSEAKERKKKSASNGKTVDSSKVKPGGFGWDDFSKEQRDTALTLAGGRSIGVNSDTQAMIMGEPGRYSARLTSKDAKVKVMVIEERSEVILDSLFVKNSKQGRGTEIVSDVVNAAKTQGFEKVTAFGAGVKGDTYNGYYTLPRLGFDGKLSSSMQKKAKDDGFDVEKVSELMSTSTGRSWWKENGAGMELEFDLSEGSSSWKTLESYNKSKSNSDGDVFQGAAVLIIHQGKLLCATRSNKEGMCGPGGKVEAGETAEEAAIREAQEEFNITPLNLIPVGEYKASNGSYLDSMVYFTDEFTGTPEADGSEMLNEQWLSIEELRSQKLFEPFEASIDMLTNLLKNHLTTKEPTDTITSKDNIDGAPYGNKNAAGPRKKKQPAPKLSKKEKAKVSSDINNVFHARYEGLSRGMITTYNPDNNQAYDYSFRVNEFDNYTFIKKRKNKG